MEVILNSYKQCIIGMQFWVMAAILFGVIFLLVNFANLCKKAYTENNQEIAENGDSSSTHQCYVIDDDFSILDDTISTNTVESFGELDQDINNLPPPYESVIMLTCDLPPSYYSLFNNSRQ